MVDPLSNVVPLFQGLVVQTDATEAAVSRLRHAMVELFTAAISSENVQAVNLAMDVRAAIEEYEPARSRTVPIESGQAGE